ncbi:MAG: FAD-dependent oxidoreductase [Fibrobacteres bacterium]|nr:FAD-dependent oxidoreductase [Fibrobacterota bacterium]
MKPKQLVIFVLLAALVAAWLLLPPETKALLSLRGLQAQMGALQEGISRHPLAYASLFVAAYAVASALSLPIASLLTLLGGALFGVAQGTFLVLIGATTGSTVAMLASRTLLRDWVKSRMGSRLQVFEKGVAREGAFYLFALRVVPVFPFFAVNLLSGMVPLRTWTYVWVSFVGMAPGTLAYVVAGRQFGQLTSLSGLVSPGLLATFAALGLLPLVSRWILAHFKAGFVYRRFRRPKAFEYDLIAIGAGAGGLVTSYIGAAVGAKVALVERHRMGGDCLNTGCVPSKALLHAGRVVHEARRLERFSTTFSDTQVDTPKVLAHVGKAIEAISVHDSVERYEGLGVHVVRGDAQVVDPWTVVVDGHRMTARSIVLATGGEPNVPAIPGIESVRTLTSDTFWDLAALPSKLVVLGGGPIGCELAQACARLGVQVVQIERGPRLLSREDPDVGDLLRKRFESEGVAVRTGRAVDRFEVDAEGRQWIVHRPTEGPGPQERDSFDAVLLALGRKARRAPWMDALGLRFREDGTIETDQQLRTNFPNILAVGDATGPFQFTHVASHQAWYAALNGLLAPFWSFAADYRVIPRCTYTDPQVARVGLSESDAKAQAIAYETSTFPLADLDRAIADDETSGFVKVLTVPGKDTLLGVVVVGAHAGELLAEWTLAMNHGLGLKKIMATIHAYPTYAESAKYAAGVWARAHQPKRALRWARRFFAWRRG